MDNASNLSPQAVQKTMSYRYVIFLVIALAYFFVYFHRVSPSVMAPELTTAFNIGATSLGLFGCMYFWAYAVGRCRLGSGRPIGIRGTLAIFVAVAGVGALLFAARRLFRDGSSWTFLVGFGVGFVTFRPCAFGRLV